ncbi:hypothetical protein [Nonomuraea maritima]|uniref:hypothetical protein n=1 Tax=Nonomuraea maritima TaxID=683260 RepID=UPI00371CDC7F
MTFDPEPRGFRGLTPVLFVVDEASHLTDTDWRRLTGRLARALRTIRWPRATHVKTRYHQRRR